MESRLKPDTKVKVNLKVYINLKYELKFNLMVLGQGFCIVDLL